MILQFRLIPEVVVKNSTEYSQTHHEADDGNAKAVESVDRIIVGTVVALLAILDFGECLQIV